VLLVPADLGDAEVCKQRRARSIDEDIAGLDITMFAQLQVSVSEPVNQWLGDAVIEIVQPSQGEAFSKSVRLRSTQSSTR